MENIYFQPNKENSEFLAKLEKLDDEYWAEVIREDLIIENGNLGNIIFSPLDKIKN